MPHKYGWRKLAFIVREGIMRSLDRRREEIWNDKQAEPHLGKLSGFSSALNEMMTKREHRRLGPSSAGSKMSHHLETHTVNPHEFCTVIENLFTLLYCVYSTGVYIPTLGLTVPKHNDETMLNYRWSLIWLKWGVWCRSQFSKRTWRFLIKSGEDLHSQSIIKVLSVIKIFC